METSVNNKCKAFTSLEQSRKLAEVLPIESADMCYGISDDTLKYDDLPWLIPYHEYTFKEFYIPCWSLAALLEALPLEVEVHKQTDGHKIYYYVESYMKRMDREIYLSTERHENLVDACVEMIYKLKEKDLI